MFSSLWTIGEAVSVDPLVLCGAYEAGVPTAPGTEGNSCDGYCWCKEPVVVVEGIAKPPHTRCGA